jgi:transcriptional regulator with XRE-family HTH domain
MSLKSDCFKYETIREQREARGLSVREVARNLNVTPSYLSGIECGQFVPSLQRLLMIQAFFENSLAEYFREDSREVLIKA